jgi:hypothetical protein
MLSGGPAALGQALGDGDFVLLVVDCLQVQKDDEGFSY